MFLRGREHAFDFVGRNQRSGGIVHRHEFGRLVYCVQARLDRILSSLTPANNRAHFSKVSPVDHVLDELEIPTDDDNFAY